MTLTSADSAALRELLGEEHLLVGSAVTPFLQDATEVRGLLGAADAVLLPTDVEEVAAVVRYCHGRGIAMTVRGGGTGYAGGCVPDGGVVIALERLNRVRSFDPLLWRMEAEAGVPTRRVQHLARENGLLFPPDPGAAEQSQIGGNAATNAGGPHAFKYGVTGQWITGLEAVLPDGEIVRVGGPLRKDVAGYDLRALLIGAEGTLGIITAVWLRFIPRPERAYPVVACFPDLASGCDAVTAAMSCGTTPAVLDYLDAAAVRIAGPAFPAALPDGAGFMLICEADGSEQEARAGRELLIETFAESATLIHAPEQPADIAALWRWREGVPIAVDAWLGGKISEDIAVPLGRLGEAIAGTETIAAAHGLESCSWGHAGDGNLHSSFLFDRADGAAVAVAEAAAGELFTLAARLGGSVSGEHGVGLVKSGQQRRIGGDAGALRWHERLKQTFDPDNLLNPGKKLV
jgi:FAD/FMN-containing dehydrogenase